MNALNHLQIINQPQLSLSSERGNLTLPRHVDIAPPPPRALNDPVKRLLRNYEPLFINNLKNKLTVTENSEKSAQKRITMLKAAAVAFLVLGIVCAASFFLLPAIGAIAGAVGLSVAITLVVWESVFLSGGLLVVLSFIPRKLVKPYIQKRNEFHEIAQELKTYIAQRTRFETFLIDELMQDAGLNLQEVVVNPLFAELYYTVQTSLNKQADLDAFEAEIAQINPDFLSDEAVMRIAEVREKLEEIRIEIEELDQQADAYRVELGLRVN